MTDTAPEDFPFPTAEKHDTPPEGAETQKKVPSDRALDKGVAESFPASDPVSVSVTKIDDNGEEAGHKTN